MLEFELKHSRKPTVALMGLAFKHDIDDLRESPAKYIAQKVMQRKQNNFFLSLNPISKSIPSLS